MMRAMLLEFPDDRTCAYLDRQYMLGPDLLVAPVFSDDGEVDVYVPAGEWTSWWDGSTVSGPGWVRQRHGFDSLPLLVRPGAVLATGARATARTTTTRTRRPSRCSTWPTARRARCGCTTASGARAGAASRCARDGDRLVHRGDLPGEWTLRWSRGPSVTGTAATLELRPSA